MGKRFIAYARLLRLSGLIGFSMAPVFGALSQVGISISLLPLFLLLLLGVLKTIHGCVMNDIFDIDVDRLSTDPSRRPLVTGEISLKTAYILSISTVLLTYMILFGYFFSTQPSFFYALICISIAAIIGNIYNKYGKKFVGSDFLVGFSEALFVLVGAYVVTPSGDLNLLTWVIFLLIFTQYLFMNMIIGGLKDADHDHLYKTRNVAITTGVEVSKEKTLHLPRSFTTIGLSIRFFSAALAFIPFIYYYKTVQLWELILMILLVGIVLLLTFRLFMLRSLAERKKVLGLFAVQGVLRYSFVPFLLIPHIGLFSSSILILMPLIWFFIIMVFSGQDIAPNL
jgi:4-hydroxybenzoate polyprenyltransferase